MTSILVHQRQQEQANTIFQPPTDAVYYVLVPTSGNYVGNYPPGYMRGSPEGEGYLIRDMGKTIRAPITPSTQVNP